MSYRGRTLVLRQVRHPFLLRFLGVSSPFPWSLSPSVGSCKGCSPCRGLASRLMSPADRRKWMSLVKFVRAVHVADEAAIFPDCFANPDLTVAFSRSPVEVAACQSKMRIHSDSLTPTSCTVTVTNSTRDDSNCPAQSGALSHTDRYRNHETSTLMDRRGHAG